LRAAAHPSCGGTLPTCGWRCTASRGAHAGCSCLGVAPLRLVHGSRADWRGPLAAERSEALHHGSARSWICMGASGRTASAASSPRRRSCQGPHSPVIHVLDSLHGCLQGRRSSSDALARSGALRRCTQACAVTE
jgi:hypothetical protein